MSEPNTNQYATIDNLLTGSRVETTQDWQQEVGAVIKQAVKARQPLRICAGRSKIGNDDTDSTLNEINLSHCRGIVDYEPSELYISVRAGTSLQEVSKTLKQEKQKFAFEPPCLDNATIGGMVATGISGPSFPYAGSARNALLGVKMVNGIGNPLTFGAPVIKNVAGFDISRLMAGSYGTLGALIELTLRVSAIAECEQTLILESTREQALERMSEINRNPWPVSAQCWYKNMHFIRLSGSSSALKTVKKIVGGDYQQNAKFWNYLSLLDLPEFELDKNQVVVRMLSKANAPLQELAQQQPFLIDWSGALRWYSVSVDSYVQMISDNHIRKFSQQGCLLWRMIKPFMLLSNLDPLTKNHTLLHQNVQRAFDPHNVCNPDIRWHL